MSQDIKKELSVGGNHDDQNELMLNVHELTTINMGLCYALEFDKNYKMSKMGIQSVIRLRIIAQEEKLSHKYKSYSTVGEFSRNL